MFTKIDDLTRQDHFYLTAADDCYFLGEYTARQGFAFSKTNSLILNFKKEVSKKGLSEWRYKEQAIRTSADAFRRALGQKDLDERTFIPIPPSKAKTDPLYDDRLSRMLRLIRPSPPLDVRELITQTSSTESVHSNDDRPGPDEIAALYGLNEDYAAPEPARIALVDDVLTTGAHFRAATSVLRSRFPNTRIVGLFIARRVPDSQLDEDMEFNVAR